MTLESQERNPYVGPRPFERQDKDLFFGRDSEASEVLSLVVAHRVLLVYAQSGAGKTSLLNAGLVPLLEEEGFEVLSLARVRGLIPEDIEPEEIPNLYVFNTLMSWAEEEVDPRRLAQISLAGFLQEREHPTDEEGLPSPRVLIFDQFEELFAFYSERWRDREKFFEQVGDALEEDPLLRVVFVIREDHIAQLDPYAPLLPEKLRTRFRLERLRAGAALSAVTGPLADTKCSFAEGVAEQLVEELLKVRVETAAGETVVVTGQFIEPVQLQVVCQSLWRDLPPDVTFITEDHLQAFGDVNQALSEFYERSVKGAAQETGVREGDLRAWFERNLITPAGTRGTVYRGREETGGIRNAAVEVLENRHLIRGEWRAGARWYELTHDRFIGPIERSNEAWRAVRRGRWLRIGAGVAAAVLILLLGIAALMTSEAAQTAQQSQATATAAAAEVEIQQRRVRELQSEKDGAEQDFTGYDLAGLDLSRVNLSQAILHAAILQDANLMETGLSEADLMAADLRGADLTKADLRNANLEGADLRGTNLTGADLSSANLEGADLRGAKLTCTNLWGANLRQAILDEKWARIANLLTKGDDQEQDFSGYDLRQVGLERANLQGANLTGADLDNACLSNADLTKASLTNASLNGADLSGAKLVNVNLSQAKLSGGSLIQTDLRGADLSGADLSLASLAGSDLSEAQLEGADLRGADLTKATLNETKGLGNLFYDDRTIWPADFVPPAETPVPQPTATPSPTPTLMPYPTSTPTPPGTITPPVGTGTATPTSTPRPAATPTATPEPAFPVDEQIAFSSTRRGGSNNLFVVKASGEGEHPAEWIPLVPCNKFFAGCFEPGDRLRFRPGSRQFLFPAPVPRGKLGMPFDIFLARLLVGQAEVTKNLTWSEEADWDQWDGTWSPDGRKIAFLSTYQNLDRIWLMDANGGNKTPLTSDPDYKDGQPAWSPTGEWIAISSQPSGSSVWELFLINPNDGSQRRQITDSGGVNWMPAWSPDGRRLAFARGEDWPEDICIINWDGSGERCRQTPWPEDRPSWSPDGNWIAFDREVDARYGTEIFIMRADFSEEHRVTYNEAADWGPAWVGK